MRARDLRSFMVAHQMPIPAELGGGRVKLLAVDDERPVLAALERALKPFAAVVEVATTTSAIEALLKVSEEFPHGLLVDLSMPDLDGVELIRRIRARRQLDGVKLIAMTASAVGEEVERALEAGADACLQKPVAAGQVLDFFRVPIAMATSGS